MHPYSFIPAAFPTAQAVAPVAARTLGMVTAVRIATVAIVPPRVMPRPASPDRMAPNRQAPNRLNRVDVNAHADACGCIEPRGGTRPAGRDWYRASAWCSPILPATPSASAPPAAVPSAAP
jgi:hypothetical protein